MAFYAEQKRRQWYCVNGINMVRIYRRKLYDDWYNSLSEEDKQYLEEQKKKRKEKAEKDLQKCVTDITALAMACFSGFNTSNHNKYHGVYDEDGFPKI